MANRAELENLVNELYQSWYPSLLGYAYRSCGSLATAEDLVQETLLLLCHDLLKDVDIRNPKGWTLTVLRHRISKHLEREKDRGLRFEPLEQRARLAADSSVENDPALSLLASDEMAHLLSFVTRREEEVILLRLEGLTYAEIATQLGIHVSSVKTLIARAIQKLQNRLETEGHEESNPHVEPGAKTS